MTDLNTTTAVPATAAATPQHRVGALVQAIKNLQPGDVGAAYRLDEVEKTAGEKYVDIVIRRAGAARGQSAPAAIETIWDGVLADIAKSAVRMTGTDAPK
jgi:hypothetical protein